MKTSIISGVESDFAAVPGDIVTRVNGIKKKVRDRLGNFSLDPDRHRDLQKFIGKAHEILLSPDAKRVRCIIPALIGEALDLDEEVCLKYGLIIELIHYTSLIHDDVIDTDDLRRGCHTLNSLFSNAQAVLIGDFMLCAVIDYSLEFDNSSTVIKLLIEGVKKMVTGVIIEQAVIREEPTLEKYREMVLLKTGSLFQLSFGLPFAGTEKLADAMQCGALLGFMFQVFDDYLDRENDAPYLNIFHILPERDVIALWDESCRELMELADKLGLSGVVRDSVDYLRTENWFQETPTPAGVMFRIPE